MNVTNILSPLCIRKHHENHVYRSFEVHAPPLSWSIRITVPKLVNNVSGIGHVR